MRDTVMQRIRRSRIAYPGIKNNQQKKLQYRNTAIVYHSCSADIKQYNCVSIKIAVIFSEWGSNGRSDVAVLTPSEFRDND